MFEKKHKLNQKLKTTKLYMVYVRLCIMIYQGALQLFQLYARNFCLQSLSKEEIFLRKGENLIVKINYSSFIDVCKYPI